MTKPKFDTNLPSFKIITIIFFFFAAGYLLGTRSGFLEALDIQSPAEEKKEEQASSTPSPKTVQKKPSVPTAASISYTGPQLWEAVNKARVEHGVNSLSQKDILCTIAAIRLAQIRGLGKLDGHDGFNATYDKYKDDPNMPNNVAEFLISGYPTPDQAVSAWLDTLGHKKLITGGEYKWGCVYAQDGFGVAITGF